MNLTRRGFLAGLVGLAVGAKALATAEPRQSPGNATAEPRQSPGNATAPMRGLQPPADAWEEDEVADWAKPGPGVRLPDFLKFIEQTGPEARANSFALIDDVARKHGPSLSLMWTKR